jgi:DNA-binding CsgD family transcriptional regulator
VRAFNIWLRLHATEAEKGWVTEAFDQVAQGLIIVGEERGILYANKGGEKILAERAHLQRIGFRLRAQDDEIADRLDSLLHLLETGRALDTEEYGIAIPREAGRSPLFLRVQPPLGLRPGQRNFGLPKAVAFLHLVDPDERPMVNLKLFGEVYRLTPAEMRFAEALTRTESIVEAARLTGVSEATARTHTQHIYAKTGAESLAGLLARIYRSAMP